MHELSLARSVVAIVEEAAGARRVLRVTLEIGERATVLPEAMTFCFEVVARGTVLEGAGLEILRTPGDALKVKSLEVEEPAGAPGAAG